MTTPAQEVLNLAFSRICEAYNLEPADTAFVWEENEAEFWLKRIVNNEVRLHFSPCYEGDKYHPALVQV
jgi:hypothetical protein